MLNNIAFQTRPIEPILYNFYGNSVNESDLNSTITVSYNVPIILTSITLGGSTNF